MTRKWTRDAVLKVSNQFQHACVLIAAAELDVFTPLSREPMTAPALAEALGTDLRATTILLDALAAMDLITKTGARYSASGDVTEWLSEDSPCNVLPVIRHRGNCMRRWAQLGVAARTGQRPPSPHSVRGEQADQAAFIGAMHNITEPVADALLAEIGPPAFHHVLDIGGASGTWTIALLRASPDATATLFDLPPVIPMARDRVTRAGLIDRVTLVAGDFYLDDLPPGADLAWLSAIAHQNAREQNRALFTKVHRALTDDGVVIIRDAVMDESRIRPAGGALFAVNMLVCTEAGGTYTFEEFREDLTAAGFTDVTLRRRDDFMNSIIRASKK